MIQDTEFWIDKYAGRAGSRSRRCFEMCCQLRDNRVSVREAKSAAKRFARLVDREKSHPFTEREALAQCRTAYKRPPREPSGTDEDEGPRKVSKTAEARRDQACRDLAKQASWDGDGNDMYELEKRHRQIEAKLYYTNFCLNRARYLAGQIRAQIDNINEPTPNP